MRRSFATYARVLPAKFKVLLNSAAFKIEDGLPNGVPKTGIYLFSSGKRHLYVGRSDNIRQRMYLHTRPSAGQNQATFAFRIAKRKLGIAGPSYKPSGSRVDLLSGSTFAKAFADAKQSIRKMHVRFVAVDDSVMQALLEIYASLRLKTPYNEFKTT